MSEQTGKRLVDILEIDGVLIGGPESHRMRLDNESLTIEWPRGIVEIPRNIAMTVIRSVANTVASEAEFAVCDAIKIGGPFRHEKSLTHIAMKDRRWTVVDLAWVIPAHPSETKKWMTRVDLDWARG